MRYGPALVVWARPPGSAVRSSTVTVAPARARQAAVARPASPPPTTTIVSSLDVGMRSSLDHTTSERRERLHPRLPSSGGGGKAGCMEGLGRLLILLGVVTVIVGVIMLMLPRIPWLGRLPGDFVVRREGFTFYFPLATSIIVSIVLTVLLNLFFRR